MNEKNKDTAEKNTNAEDFVNRDELDFKEKNNNELEDLKRELNETKEALLRALADAENTRKRAIKDREDAIKYGIANFTKDILTISDNLNRALTTKIAETNDSTKAMFDGIELINKDLESILNKNGIKRIHPKNEIFDPNFHQVVFENEDSQMQPGTIIEVFQDGFTINDRLLRPAVVGVAKQKQSNND